MKKFIECIECGYVFVGNPDVCECPNCIRITWEEYRKHYGKELAALNRRKS